jgi:hypothetical protein
VKGYDVHSISAAATPPMPNQFLVLYYLPLFQFVKPLVKRHPAALTKQMICPDFPSILVVR